jgi:chemosensory pili system protein ChpA (sensor histidine kinase/response regulator)
MLFPQYRAALQLAAAERVHPADLWQIDWQWHEVAADPTASPRPADEDARATMESLVLALMRQPAGAGRRGALMQMSELCAGLGAGVRPAPGGGGRLGTLWQLAAAVFEAQALGLLGSDAYTQRIASRLLAQLRTSARGQTELSDRLAQDLLFFCSHARPHDAERAPRLAAVRQAWRLDGQPTADYETPRLGRFDPAQLTLARKRVAVARESWSAVAAGERHRVSGLVEQFALVGDSLQKLFPSGEVLAQALQAAAAHTVAAHLPPHAPLAMEVATGILYLDASLEDGELDDPELAARVLALAQRIDDARGGADPQPLDAWMEELYRRVSDRQTMGSVVQELRASLSEVEKQIDQYFRNPAERQLLIPVPAQLSAMRGVFSVLGLDQASHAVLHLRDEVDALAQTEVDPQRAIQTGTFDRLADNLGALSFLIDMLAVQPQLAKSLFRYDPETGSLSAVMGQSERVSAFALLDEAPTPPAAAQPDADAAAQQAPALPTAATQPAATDRALEDDPEMRAIFIDEAGEVVAAALAALDRLAEAPEGSAEMAELRRAFHTLKGSSRMVGLREFGEAAWACEQLYNARLAHGSRMDGPLRLFTGEALHYFGAWTQAVAARRDDGHRAAAVARAADALRLEGQRLPIELPVAPPPAPAEVSLEALFARVPDLPSAADLDLHLPPLPPLPDSEADEPAPVVEEASFELRLPEIREPDSVPAPAAEVAPAQGEAAPWRLQLSLDEPAPEAATAALPAPEVESLEYELAELEQVFAGLAEPPPAPPVEEDEPVKVIGPLRIGIPLFNIFLNEADELSRRLSIELAEWALEHERHPVPASAEALAHSLAGNSATVGYAELSALARLLEHALARSHRGGPGRAGEAELFSDAADEIRRLLHQFAAGFLRPVAAELMARLAEHERWPSVSLPAPAPDGLLPPPVADARGDDDEAIDAEDLIDPELFPIFEEEADDLLPQLQRRLREWIDRPADSGAAAACMRTLHTFKGGARLAGALRLGELAHRLETAIERLAAGDEVRAEALDPLLARADAMTLAFEALRKPRPTVAPVAAPPALPVPEPAPAQPEAVPEGLPQTAADDEAPVSAAAAAPGRTIDWGRFPAAEAAAVALAEPAAAAGGAVRVRAGLLDRLVNQAGEVSIARARIDADVKQMQAALGELTDSLDRMRRQLRDIELQAETQIGSRIEAAKAAATEFDPLEMDRYTRLQELTRFMAESVNDVATLQRSLQRTLQSTEDELASQSRLTRELQDDLLRTRMVEFESMTDRLYRTVRQAAKETGKQVRLEIVGGAIEIDRGVLDRMTGPFEHLLRNSVAHGVEAPEARLAAGKEAGGTITISVAQAGNEVAVEFADDGAGLDLDRIRARGVERGLLAADAAVSTSELAQLIFQPGFSTADTVTELAGRGVGLDVVRAEVNAIGGRIETLSDAGAGTRFRLLLPLTTAVTQVVMLRCGSAQVAVPSTLIEIVRRVATADVERAYVEGRYEYAGESLPFFWLAALLQPGASGEIAGRLQTVIVIRSARQRVAVHVDEVVGNQEVVVKNVGPQLSRLPGLAGVTLLPSGAVALIYNPVALAAVYGEAAHARVRAGAAAFPAQPAPGAPARAPLVLVVDDSLTVRRVTQRLLVREGYRVVTAKDGFEALERLAEERPVVLLSDIEMPRMDGFDLVRNVRADPRLAGLPVVMITSRIAQKHRDYAAELGVEHYLGKPYAEEELLSLVARYAGTDIAT